MIQVVYTASMLREYQKLPPDLQDEVKEKLELFKADQFHPFLKTHKLKGALRAQWGFSVNYAYRVIFMYDSKNTVAFLHVGDHDIYR
jgi:mRNA-degrading endonuclease RelE of RelBE toxin-antitoxin system